MATASVQLLPISATLPDGSTFNAAAALARVQGTVAVSIDPKKHYLVLDYDATTDEFAWWTFRLPDNYASGGTGYVQWHTTTIAGSVVWGMRVGAITAGDADTPIEHATVAVTALTGVNATEANRLVSTTLSLSMDSAAAGDLLTVAVYRSAANASDSASVDARLVAAEFMYTTT